ncbi:hypothetical protein AVEN_138786-1 [Araneus ventricosus]|uniref:DUF5641 domain-containing protein n=1 Tax=Araneus ventricosus TaxID=182803 RepID=A0A4Y2M4S6_ARAVE|nr:hypothetical protein AVEN_138786-1 [Araneus ventricosus]
MRVRLSGRKCFGHRLRLPYPSCGHASFSGRPSRRGSSSLEICRHLPTPPRWTSHYGAIGDTNCNSHSVGYILSGKIYSKEVPEAVIHSTLCDNLTKFWTLEEVSSNVTVGRDADPCELFYQQSVDRNAEGRYVVSLPFKEDQTLGESKARAIQLFYALENKLNRKPQLKETFCKFMNGYLSLDHIVAEVLLWVCGLNSPTRRIMENEGLFTNMQENTYHRWRSSLQMKEFFWTRWTRDVLHHMQSRPKWQQHCPSIKKGDLVIIQANNLPRLAWLGPWPHSGADPRSRWNPKSYQPSHCNGTC